MHHSWAAPRLPPYEDVLPSSPFQTHFCLLHFSFILSRLIFFTLLPSMLNLLVDSKNWELVSSYAWLLKKLNRAQIIKSKNQPLSSLIPNLKENLVTYVTVKKLEKTILRLFLKNTSIQMNVFKWFVYSWMSTNYMQLVWDVLSTYLTWPLHYTRKRPHGT